MGRLFFLAIHQGICWYVLLQPFKSVLWKRTRMHYVNLFLKVHTTKKQIYFDPSDLVKFVFNFRALERCTKGATASTRSGAARSRWKPKFRNLREFCPTRPTSSSTSPTRAKAPISGFSRLTSTFCKTGDVTGYRTSFLIQMKSFCLINK